MIPCELEHDLHFLMTNQKSESPEQTCHLISISLASLLAFCLCVASCTGWPSHLCEDHCSESKVNLLTPEDLSKFPLGKFISELAFLVPVKPMQRNGHFWLLFISVQRSYLKEVKQISASTFLLGSINFSPLTISEIGVPIQWLSLNNFLPGTDLFQDHM